MRIWFLPREVRSLGLQAVFLDRFEIGQVRAGYWLETQQQWMQIALWFFL